MDVPNTRKYILIPEYRPLYAMRKCFGPLHGPLSQPCPTSLDIIGELLEQSGRDALTIFEVVPEGKGYSKPVRLTPANYKLPYAEILAAADPTKKITFTSPLPKPVQPSTTPPTPKEEIPQVPPTKPEIRGSFNEASTEPEPAAEETPAEPEAPAATIEDDSTPGVTDLGPNDPDPKTSVTVITTPEVTESTAAEAVNSQKNITLTKAERKALAREAAKNGNK